MLQSRRRKYSWRENDRKLRESVSIPTKRESRPRLESASICLRMPSSWSRNHQALPSCIFPGARAVVEAADDGGERLVVGGVQVVDDGLGQLAGRVQAIEKARQRDRLREVGDGVVAGVGAERGHPARAGVAQRAEVELLRPAAPVVQHRQVVEQRRTQLLGLLGRRRLPGARLGEDGGHLALGVVGDVEALEAVVRGAAAGRVKRVVPLGERVAQLVERPDRRVRRGAERVDPGVPAGEDRAAPAPDRGARSGRAW